MTYSYNGIVSPTNAFQTLQPRSVVCDCNVFDMTRVQRDPPPSQNDSIYHVVV